MSKSKLELSGKTDAEIVAFADAHKTAMTGNANFASPLPSAADFEAKVAAAAAALADVEAKRMAWRMAVATKDEAIDMLRAALTARASYVDSASGGEETKILSSGFLVRAARSPSTPLPAPTGVQAEHGAMEGEIDLSWDRVPGADSYVTQSSPNVLPRTWTQVQVVTQASCTATDLTSGQLHVFRVAAVGPLGQGPWSGEASKRAL